LVRGIQEDKQGNIWFSTGEGICFFNGKEFTTIPLKETGEWHLDEEDLWFPAFQNGVSRYSNGLLENLTIPVSQKDTDYDGERMDRPYHYPYSGIKTYRDKDGKLWIGTFNRGVVGYDGKTFEYHNPNKFGIGTIRSLFQDKKGRLWFCSGMESNLVLYTWNGASFDVINPIVEQE
jgi:ligand-binding sensor domain-containing protein